MKSTGFWRAFALATSLVLGAPAMAQDMTADTVVATVNGTEITLGQMIVLRGTLSEQYQALPDDVLVFHVEHLGVPGLNAERCLVWMKMKS